MLKLKKESFFIFSYELRSLHLCIPFDLFQRRRSNHLSLFGATQKEYNGPMLDDTFAVGGAYCTCYVCGW